MYSTVDHSTKATLESSPVIGFMEIHENLINGPWPVMVYLVPIIGFGDQLVTKIQQSVVLDRGSDLFHQIEEKVKIVPRGQAQTKYFIGFYEMTDISTRIILAHITLTGRVDRRKITGKFRITHNHPPFTGQDRAVSTDPGRQDTVKHIDAANRCLDKITGCRHH